MCLGVTVGAYILTLFAVNGQYEDTLFKGFWLNPFSIGDVIVYVSLR